MVHSGASGRLAAHSETRVVLRRWVQKGVSGWHVPKCHTPKVSERMFRRSFEGVFRQGFAMASKGVSGHAALSEGLRKGVLRCGTFQRWFSKGSPRGMLRAGCRRGLPEDFGSEGGFRRRFRRGSSERGLRRVSERVSSKEVA